MQPRSSWLLRLLQVLQRGEAVGLLRPTEPGGAAGAGAAVAAKAVADVALQGEGGTERLAAGLAEKHRRSRSSGREGREGREGAERGEGKETRRRGTATTTATATATATAIAIDFNICDVCSRSHLLSVSHKKKLIHTRPKIDCKRSNKSISEIRN